MSSGQRVWAIVYVSHRLGEVRQIADTVTVLRDGRMVASGPIDDFDDAALVRHMVGRTMEQLTRRASRATEQVVLRVSHLSRRRSFQDVSFELHAGEVLGLAGLIGSGRSSLGRALFGQRPATSGTIEVAGRVRRLRSVPSAIAAGIGMVPEDRQSQGLFMPDDALSNTALVRLSDFVRGWLIADRKARALNG